MVFCFVAIFARQCLPQCFFMTRVSFSCWFLCILKIQINSAIQILLQFPTHCIMYGFIFYRVCYNIYIQAFYTIQQSDNDIVFVALAYQGIGSGSITKSSHQKTGFFFSDPCNYGADPISLNGYRIIFRIFQKLSVQELVTPPFLYHDPEYVKATIHAPTEVSANQ